MRNVFLPFHVPDIGEEEIEAVTQTLRSGWLTTGPQAKAFETEFARYVQAEHAVALNSGTAALHLALDAIGLRAGDEVIVPTMTFAATAEVVRYFGAVPVLVDCRPDTLNIDAEQVARAITPRTRAVIPVHVGGQPCDMDPLMELARARGLTVIEDAAHAIPARYKGRMIGTIGDMTCFSFYATKTITTGEGGMVTTERSDYAERIRIMSLHGISRNAWNRYAADGSWYYEILYPGYKYNLTDLAASLGLAQLRKAERFWRARQRVAQLYDEGFRDLPEVGVPCVSPDVQHAWHLYQIQLDVERLRIDRGAFVELLRKANVGSSVHFIPLHVHPYYRETFGYAPEDFPNAYAAYQRIVSLPIYSKMTDQDVHEVVDVVRDIVTQHRR